MDYDIPKCHSAQSTGQSMKSTIDIDYMYYCDCSLIIFKNYFIEPLPEGFLEQELSCQSQSARHWPAFHREQTTKNSQSVRGRRKTENVPALLGSALVS